MSRWFDPSAPLPPEAAAAPVEHVYRRILAFMRQFWRGIGLGVLFAMLSSLLVTLQPWPIKLVIDGVLRTTDGVSRLNLGPFGDVVSETDRERLMVAGGLAGAFLAITVVGVLLNAASFYIIARTA